MNMFDGNFDFVPDMDGDGDHDMMDLLIFDDVLREEEDEDDRIGGSGWLDDSDFGDSDD